LNRYSKGVYWLSDVKVETIMQWIRVATYKQCKHGHSYLGQNTHPLGILIVSVTVPI
jgi:hypothetical protein